MSDNGNNPIVEVHALLDGLVSNVSTLERHIDEWKRSTNTALNQIAQWDAADFADRKARQLRLDHELRLLRWGVGLSLLLLVVVISLFIGAQLK